MRKRNARRREGHGLAGRRPRLPAGTRRGLTVGAVSRPTLAALTVLIAAALAGVSRPAQAARPWESPLHRPSLSVPFSFDPLRPYGPGQRRVAELAGRSGEPARAPCPGPVTFAGRLPGGAGVTVACGGILATLTGLAGVAVRRGAVVAPGEPVGRVGRSGRLRLGARRAGRRHGYMDPMALIGAGGRPPILAPPPRAPRRPRVPRRAAPPGAEPVAPVILLGAGWLGLGVASSAIGLGLALRRPAARVPAGARAARPAGR